MHTETRAPGSSASRRVSHSRNWNDATSSVVVQAAVKQSVVVAGSVPVNSTS